MLFSIDLHEGFIDVERITVASMTALQTPGVDGSKLDAPQSYRFTSDDYAALGQDILDISVAQIESIVQPGGVGNDIWWESVAPMGIHSPILV